MRGHAYTGDQPLAIEIRPFNAESEGSDPTPSEPSQDSRAASYMDGLRNRISGQDETQRKVWLKKVKPPVVHKPLPPARPDWMVITKVPPAVTKNSALTSRPFGSPKKRVPKP
jgi:hypothetical protein